MGRTRKAEPTSPPSSPDSAQPAVPDRELHRPGQAPGGGGRVPWAGPRGGLDPPAQQYISRGPLTSQSCWLVIRSRTAFTNQPTSESPRPSLMFPPARSMARGRDSRPQKAFLGKSRNSWLST